VVVVGEVSVVIAEALAIVAVAAAMKKRMGPQLVLSIALLWKTSQVGSLGRI